MNIARPNKEDLDAVWELVAFLNKIEQGLNPIYQPADPEFGRINNEHRKIQSQKRP